MHEISADRLRELVDYDPETGVFRWKYRKSIRVKKVGAIAGGVGSKGYWQIRIDGQLFYAHRLACRWMTGKWPQEIDHANRNKLDNRWANLRICSRPENHYNRLAQANNSSGFKGVTFNKRLGKWAAQINAECKHINLGLFATIEEANEAYRRAALELHGQFARL